MTTNITDKPDLITYSFRAECGYDLALFYCNAKQRAIETGSQFIDDQITNGIGFQFRSSMSLETLRDVLRQQIDSHVILQTLQPLPLAGRSLNRDYDIR